MSSTSSPSRGRILPNATAKARSADSGLETTYVDERKTAGRAEPTDRRGSKPRVRTAVAGRTTYGGCFLRRAIVVPPGGLAEEPADHNPSEISRDRELL